MLTEKQRLRYNHAQPRNTLDYQTPVQFAITCMEKNVDLVLRRSGPRPHPKVSTMKQTRSPHSYNDWSLPSGLSYSPFDSANSETASRGDWRWPPALPRPSWFTCQWAPILPYSLVRPTQSLPHHRNEGSCSTEPSPHQMLSTLRDAFGLPERNSAACERARDAGAARAE